MRPTRKRNQRFTAVVCVALALNVQAKANGVETGQPAPNCALTPVANPRSYDLHKFHGKVLYVDFWASWCAPCARSFSFMNDLDRDLRGRGLQVVAINLDEKTGDARDFLAKYPANFAVAVDGDGRCPRDFGVQGMPSSYVVDRRGIVRHIHLGFRPGEAEKLRVLIEELLAEGAARP
jgi:thiol-disulfide isomerase/thioredoxin